LIKVKRAGNSPESTSRRVKTDRVAGGTQALKKEARLTVKKRRLAIADSNRLMRPLCIQPVRVKAGMDSRIDGVTWMMAKDKTTLR